MICRGLLRGLRRVRGEGDRLSLLPRSGTLLNVYHAFANVAKTSDLILMILDATKRAEQRALLEGELEAVGIRLNRDPPYGSLSGDNMGFTVALIRC